MVAAETGVQSGAADDHESFPESDLQPKRWFLDGPASQGVVASWTGIGETTVNVRERASFFEMRLE
jgi:hypothetical protein